MIFGLYVVTATLASSTPQSVIEETRIFGIGLIGIGFGTLVIGSYFGLR